jgi:hypothetical protein
MDDGLTIAKRDAVLQITVHLIFWNDPSLGSGVLDQLRQAQLAMSRNVPERRFPYSPLHFVKLPTRKPPIAIDARYPT